MRAHVPLLINICSIEPSFTILTTILTIILTVQCCTPPLINTTLHLLDSTSHPPATPETADKRTAAEALFPLPLHTPPCILPAACTAAICAALHLWFPLSLARHLPL